MFTSWWRGIIKDYITDYIKDYIKAEKAGYMAIQSRTVGQEQYCKNCSEFRNVTDGRTD